MPSRTERDPLLRHPAPREASSPSPLSHNSQYAKAHHNVENDVLPESATVGRTIGWSSAYMLVISRVIGSGIFAMPGIILQDVGSPGMALVVWVVGAVIAWAALAIDLEYGCMLPRSGGPKVYLEYTYRWPRFLASTMIAVQAVVLGFTANNCIVFAKYTLFAAGHQHDADGTTVKAIAIGLLTIITVMHGCFYNTGIRVQNVLGWIKISLVTFMIATGLAVTAFRAWESHSVPALRGRFWANTEWSWNSISTGIFKVFYSYAGLSNLNNVLNEVKNPIRALKLVGPVALVTACVMYVLVNIAYMLVVPLEEVKRSQELIAALFFSRVFGSAFGDIFLPLAIAISAAGNVMVVTFSLARLNQEIARQGFLPYASLIASSEPFGAPLGALIVHFVPSALVISLPPADTVYAFIANVEGYAAQFFALALAVGLASLRIRRRELLRPFRAWWTAIVFRIVASFALILAPFFPGRSKPISDRYYSIVAIIVLLSGIVYWYIWTRFIPRIHGYRLEEEADVLSDGTTVARLVKREQAVPDT